MGKKLCASGFVDPIIRIYCQMDDLVLKKIKLSPYYNEREFTEFISSFVGLLNIAQIQGLIGKDFVLTRITSFMSEYGKIVPSGIAKQAENMASRSGRPIDDYTLNPNHCLRDSEGNWDGRRRDEQKYIAYPKYLYIYALKSYAPEEVTKEVVKKI